MSEHVGIDFGTTNSAIARTTGRDAATLVPLKTAAGDSQPSWRSVLYFEPGRGTRAATGSDAIERYLETAGEGRLIQSVKSHLASASFKKTSILNRAWGLDELIGLFLKSLRRCATCDLGTRAAVGRPVHYWGAESDEDDERALERMRAALAIAGFDDVTFVYEPVAAAFHYAERLSSEELILVADFGGGTSDFSLVRVGPTADPSAPDTILANSGIGIGGDTFDGAIVDHVVSPLLGKGSEYTDEFGAAMPAPPWLYSALRRWHHLSFLKSRDNMRLLEKIQQGSNRPEQIDAFIEIIEDDLGFALQRAVERAKIDLSDQPTADFRFAPVGLAQPVELGDFDQWIDDPIATIEQLIDDVLAAGGVEAAQVDRVFATGGTSFVPRVRALLERRFGADRVASGGELTSVASGLAACAARL